MLHPSAIKTSDEKKPTALPRWNCVSRILAKTENCCRIRQGYYGTVLEQVVVEHPVFHLQGVGASMFEKTF